MCIRGINLDEASRCVHYHQINDIIGLKCNQCKKYYACYKCHNAMENHLFDPISLSDPAPIICGNCQHNLTYKQYQKGRCIFCNHPFNPNCRKHTAIYFSL